MPAIAPSSPAKGTEFSDAPLGVRRLVSLDALSRNAKRQRDEAPWSDPKLSTPVDTTKPFLGWELCPLRHDPIWHTLTATQQLRYNQLAGLMHNELIVFFETGIAATMLPRLSTDASLPADFRAVLLEFLEDEREHTQHFRRLSRASMPGWYDESDTHILRLPAMVTRSLHFMTQRPGMFPMLFWVMLLMEERSLLISRRVMDEPAACPRWQAVYRAHLLDEVRHVQTDWHLLERFWAGRSRAVRLMNAKLLEATVLGLFVKPRRANVRLIDLLVADCPELIGRRDELVTAVRMLHRRPGYRAMMFSEPVTPVACRLFHEFPELHGLWRRMTG